MPTSTQKFSPCAIFRFVTCRQPSSGILSRLDSPQYMHLITHHQNLTISPSESDKFFVAHRGKSPSPTIVPNWQSVTPRSPLPAACHLISFPTHTTNFSIPQLPFSLTSSIPKTSNHFQTEPRELFSVARLYFRRHISSAARAGGNGSRLQNLHWDI